MPVQDWHTVQAFLCQSQIGTLCQPPDWHTLQSRIVRNSGLCALKHKEAMLLCALKHKRLGIKNCARLFEPYCSGLCKPYCSGLFEPYCSPLALYVYKSKGARSNGRPHGMGCCSCELLSYGLTGWRYAWYARGRGSFIAASISRLVVSRQCANHGNRRILPKLVTVSTPAYFSEKWPRLPLVFSQRQTGAILSRCSSVLHASHGTYVTQ